MTRGHGDTKTRSVEETIGHLLLGVPCPECNYPLELNPKPTGPLDRAKCCRKGCTYAGPVPVQIEMMALGAPTLPGIDGEDTEMAKRSTIPPAEAEVTTPQEQPTSNGADYLRQLVQHADHRQKGRPLMETMGSKDGRLFGDILFDQVSTLDLHDIYPSDDQGRRDWGDLEELGRNIKEHGLQEPVIVRYNPLPVSNSCISRFQLVAGERRWRAHRAVGLKTIQAIVRRLDDRQASEIHLLENMQRRDLNPIEEAREFKRYLERTGATQAELGKVVGKKQASVANCLRLLDCPEPVQQMVISGDITAYHARLLLGLDPDYPTAGYVYVDKFNIEPGRILDKAKEMTSTQLEKAVRAINADVKRKKKWQQEEEERKAKLEAQRAELAAKAAESGQEAGSVLVAPDSWTNPPGYGPVPREQSTDGQRIVETDCETCDKKAPCLFPSRGEVTLSGDQECRIRTREKLAEAARALDEAEAARRRELKERILMAMTPIERRRLALYNRAWRTLYNEDAYTKVWGELGEEPSEDLLTREGAESVVERVIARPGSGEEAAIRRWLVERFGIDREWLLGPEPATGEGEAPTGGSEARLVCRECGRVSTAEDPDEDWEEDDLCAICAARLEGEGGDE